MNFYEFKIKNIHNQIVDFNIYKNKTILVVNVASKCGFTKQYVELESLYKKYKDKDFIILGFPCNQFLKQEFDEDDKILEFCKTKFDVTFDMFSKIDVKGKNINPLFEFLINEDKSFTSPKNIKWNFEKFLINKNGELIKRYLSKETPFSFEKNIEEIL